MNSVSDMQNVLKRVTAAKRAKARFAYQRAVETARMQNNTSHLMHIARPKTGMCMVYYMNYNMRSPIFTKGYGHYNPTV